MILASPTDSETGDGPPGGGRLRGADRGAGDKYSPLVKACGTAFLDLHLKGDKAAKEYLKKDGGFTTFAGKATEYSAK
jgi:hypothetical protein